MLRLTALHLYFVKSCRGLAVTSAEVDARGLVGDRRFMVIDADGRFLTQRAHPRLALIETTLTKTELILAASGHGSTRIPLQPKTQNAKPKTVTVWKDTVTADDCGDEPAAWLTDFLGLSCRLVHTGAAYSRPLPTRKLPSTLDVDIAAWSQAGRIEGRPTPGGGGG